MNKLKKVIVGKITPFLDRYQMIREIRSRVMIPEQKIVRGSNKGKKEIRRVKKRTTLSLSLSLS
ncbi:hypothetical protein Peur_035385 [Populus x canadensis]